MRLDISSVPAGGRAGVANDGYWGIPVKPSTTYHVSLYARASSGFSGPLMVDIESADGKTIVASGTIPSVGAAWKKYSVVLTTGAGVAESTDCRFVVSAKSPGSIWLDLVSVFPPTYDNTPNGNRIDLMQKLADMHQSFLRLPGGNYLEGNTIATRFNWKNTIGPVEHRPGHWGCWGYRSADGLGLLEYMEWCEDLHIQPLLAVYAGYSLGGEHVAAGPELQPFVQDALDEIEYCTGDVSTKWGAERAKDGHPAPFKIDYVEIGNEDGFDRSHSYAGRFGQFYDAIKAKYPNLKLIATMWLPGIKTDVIDDHYYRSAAGMELDTHHYDTLDRSGPKIFVGEWASTEGSPTPNWKASLGDAAWLTGLERDSDIVVMASYAPLLVNVNPKGGQWSTNLIGYDALHSFGSPSYYVQLTFAQNKGDKVLPVEIEPQSSQAQKDVLLTGGIGLGTWQTNSEYTQISVTSGGTTLYQPDLTSTVQASGFAPQDGTWSIADGAIQQTSLKANCRATTGNKPDWTDYDLKLRARKISGDEGFMVFFRVQDNDNFIDWNIGGWGNSRTSLQECIDGVNFELGNSPRVTVETGRWYDIEIQVTGEHIRCLLDGKLIQEENIRSGGVAPIYSTASRDTATGDVIVKVVNVSSSGQLLDVALPGLKSTAKIATLIEMTGQPSDQNSLENPMKVAPKVSKIAWHGASEQLTFPAYSVSVLRIPQR